MRFTPLVIVALSVFGVTGCDNDVPRVTAPLTLHAPRSVVVASACDNLVFHRAEVEQLRLFPSGEVRIDAIQMLAAVNEVCGSNLPLARERMLFYVQFTIDHFGPVLTPNPSDDPFFASKSAAMVNHLNTLFEYVGYPLPNVPPAAFEPGGAAGVIQDIAGGREVALLYKAAITIPPQDGAGDPRGHLVTILRVASPCLGSTNLVQSGPCYQFTAYPAVAPKFSPKAQEGICQYVATSNDGIAGLSPALGHVEGSLTLVTGNVPGYYPTFCIDGHPELLAGSWTGGLGDIAKRLASLAKRAIGIAPAYAAHGGLGGISEGLSVFSAFDVTVFRTNLGTTVGPPPAPDAGRWFKSVSPPGSITVQRLLGDLTDYPVVLDQGGGNCASCGGLLLRGTIGGTSFPTDGVYLVSWRSVESSPTSKGAPFVLRGSDGRLIAKLSYVSRSSKDQLTFNDVVVGSWVKKKSQKFDITVNLFTHKTSLSINGTPVAIAQNVAFLTGATDLASIAAEFSGIDAGVIGWDDIEIKRLADD